MAQLVLFLCPNCRFQSRTRTRTRTRTQGLAYLQETTHLRCRPDPIQQSLRELRTKTVSYSGYQEIRMIAYSFSSVPYPHR